MFLVITDYRSNEPTETPQHQSYQAISQPFDQLCHQLFLAEYKKLGMGDAPLHPIGKREPITRNALNARGFRAEPVLASFAP